MTEILGQCQFRLERRDFCLDVAFEIPARGVLGLFGESGSGKTSVLRCIAGLEPEVKGRLQIRDQDWLTESGPRIPTHRRRVGFVFQETRLFPHLNVRDNLKYGQTRNRGTPDTIDWDYTIELLGIGHLLDREPHQLSGGEKQRVAIARALQSRPEMLLMDEPLASLDAARKQEILPFLERLHQEISVPIIFVSHQVEELQRLCDRLIVLEAGKKTYEGTMVDAMTSKDAPFLELDNASVLISGVVEGYDPVVACSTVAIADGIKFHLSDHLEPGRKVRLRVLAKDVSLSPTEPPPSTILNIMKAVVGPLVAETAHHVTLIIALGNQKILSRISRKSYAEISLKEGTPVFLQVKSVSVHGIMPMTKAPTR